jgi:hypothetical protein
MELVTPWCWRGRISRLSGEKMHEAWFGSPEQERVTNAGVFPAGGTNGDRGTTVAVAVPASPAVSVLDGARLDTVTINEDVH